MREDVKITKVYRFDELTEEAKEKAIEKLWDINVDYEWWDCVFEDAKTIGLEITEFDIDRGSYCKGKWIEDAEDAARLILENHGEVCETYKDAINFQAELKQAQEMRNKAHGAHDRGQLRLALEYAQIGLDLVMKCVRGVQ